MTRTGLQPGQNHIFCHDKERYGQDDSPTIPRLELLENFLPTWSTHNVQFYDQDANNVLDINDMIANRYLQITGKLTHVNVFSNLRWPNYPNNSLGASPVLGYIMSPWIDPTTQLAYCPQQTHYNSPDPMMRVLKELVSVDTEALYMAEREPLSQTDQDGNKILIPSDYLLINESTLNKVWFVAINGVVKSPTSEEVAKKQVMFYWPLDFNHPLVKKSNQKTYLIKHPNQFQDQLKALPHPAGMITHDKRFGCIPKL